LDGLGELTKKILTHGLIHQRTLPYFNDLAIAKGFFGKIVAPALRVLGA
jgi:hypothetical protein